MAKPNSDDLRECLFHSVGSGRSRHETAKLFGVGPSCVIKLMKLYQTTGQQQPK
jgi:transposase